MSTSAVLESLLREGLNNPTYVEAKDCGEMCDGSRFEITVVAVEFEGKPLLQQHRLVNKIIESERAKIHALTLKTIAPSKWTGLPTEGSL